MSKTETQTQREIWLALGTDCRLFRVNTGRGYISNASDRPKRLSANDRGTAYINGKTIQLKAGDVIIHKGRPVALGMAFADGSPVVGTTDLIGYTIVKITPDMVGKSLPVYTAVDAKQEGGGRVSKDQQNYVEQINRVNGIAGIADSAQSARAIINTWLQKNNSELFVLK